MSILVVGSLNLDITMYVSQFVEPGQTQMARSMKMSDGGKGGNQATAIARLHHPVTLFACVGKDENGKQLLHHLQEDGVNADYVKESETSPTGLAMIEVDEKGQNRILVNRGANDDYDVSYLLQHNDVFEEVDVILLQQEIPLPTIYEVLKIAHETNKKIILNPAPINLEFDSSYYAFVDYLTPNEIELAQITPSNLSLVEQIQYLEQKGIQRVIVTLGEKGCAYLEGEELIVVPALEVEAIDTVGAGDCFNGALAYAIDQGMEIKEACAFAVIASGCSVTRQGARTSMPTLEEVLSRKGEYHA